MTCSLTVGTTVWMFEPRGAIIPPLPTRSGDKAPAEMVSQALEHPFGYAALRLALTPDDHVAVVVDDQLPHVGELLAAVLNHIVTAGVDPAAITVIVPRANADQSFVDTLPDAFADVTVETHDAQEEKRHAYLATTKAGRRVYLNRSLVESDFVVVITGTRRQRPRGMSLVFPTLSNEETKTTEILDGEAIEIAWLLGTPFLVHVIEGMGNSVAEVMAGLVDIQPEVTRIHAQYWTYEIQDRADLVIATIAGPEDKVTFADWATAAKNARRAVTPEGRIVVLSTSSVTAGDLENIRTFHAAGAAAKHLADGPAKDWARVAAKYRLTLASGLSDETTEEIFATPIHTPEELQRVIDAAKSIVILPDAHKVRVKVLSEATEAE